MASERACVFTYSGFTRYAKAKLNQRTNIRPLPPSTALFAFFFLSGVVVTSATFIIYGETIWDGCTDSKFENKLLVSMAMITAAHFNLAANIAMNIVSPASDFANLSPKRINFRTGGCITGLIGILIFPWKLIADPNGYIYYAQLVAYSQLLGAG
ncbi:MAG: cytosine permease [Chitinophagaceae bacterium]|nr:cytosine permease [Chitinophagaceae bacterium]